jgi:hypothetical protein
MEGCPRCGGGIPNTPQRGEYPGALSRVDNETEICSACGLDEGMFHFLHPTEPLPPITERIDLGYW